MQKQELEALLKKQTSNIAKALENDGWVNCKNDEVLSELNLVDLIQKEAFETDEYKKGRYIHQAVYGGTVVNGKVYEFIMYDRSKIHRLKNYSFTDKFEVMMRELKD